MVVKQSSSYYKFDNLTKESQMWTVYFHTLTADNCYHICYGQMNGRPLKLETVLRLAKNFWKANNRRLKLTDLYAINTGGYNSVQHVAYVKIDFSECDSDELKIAT